MAGRREAGVMVVSWWIIGASRFGAGVPLGSVVQHTGAGMALSFFAYYGFCGGLTVVVRGGG